MFSGDEDESKQIQVQQIIAKWDKEGDGKLDFEEFHEWYSSAMSQVDEEDALAKVFAVFNKNGDGFITRQELKEGLSLLDRVSEKDVDKMMLEADLNKDGKIDKEEFFEIMRKQ